MKLRCCFGSSLEDESDLNTSAGSSASHLFDGRGGPYLEDFSRISAPEESMDDDGIRD
ncbi:hypothetical protein [Streptomyces chartreusis]|uniref:Uncharacterized protein n=1 Tax=Streptomyces chartreusis TaxID=1969 RepID=A0A7H8TG46_STRCX|nr:hypothetical protein [Streptomyces chartreusis]QKZ22012.1 hypothetical protein HUT05_34510 [Streptomyces chartreusis]